MNPNAQLIQSQLADLRTYMTEQGWSAYMIPSNDPHNSEYPADTWAIRAYMSGFTGSAGTLVVTVEHAALWTDGRYFIQADEELEGTGISVMKSGLDGVPGPLDWLSDVLASGAVVAMTAQVCMQADYERYASKLAQSRLTFKLTEDPFDQLWHQRPELSKQGLIIHEEVLAGASATTKITAIRERMTRHGADALVMSALDEIGWLLNLRGYDVPFNPVFYAYLLLTHEEATLFIHTDKLTDEVRHHLSDAGVTVQGYARVTERLASLAEETAIMADPAQTNAELWAAFHEKNIRRTDSPVKLAKAIKNDTEIRCLRRTMVKDGVALFRSKRRLDAALETGGGMDEYTFGEVIAAERAKMPHYYGESFNAIVGYKGHGAIIHYRAPTNGSAQIQREGILLCDSGGQYHDGTTDITRTWALGEATDRQREHYTRVLKGHIALAKAVFPKGTTGIQLDALARQYLWQAQCDYQHGTGHGVGYFMNVHEPPQGIRSELTGRGSTVFEPGMYTSNEPGYYEEGAYGIRLENLIICVPADTEGRWLRHETITLYPFDTTLIDRALMTSEEVAWLNNYHRKVYHMLAPELNEDERVALERDCAPLTLS